MIQPIQLLGQPAMRLRSTDGAQASVLLQGAHIVSWIPAGDQERLYLWPSAVAGPGQAVRGGIPVVFPQFASRARADVRPGPVPHHGLAHTRAWQWVEGAERDGAAIGVLRLSSDEATCALWPHDFELELTLSLGGLQLDVELAVTNTGHAPFDFTAALHTCLRCDDVRRARLGGLYGVRYVDNLSGIEQQQEMDPFSFVGEIDRTYFDARAPLRLTTAMGNMAIRSEGFDDVVVWNPGPQGLVSGLSPKGEHRNAPHEATLMSDLPDGDWLQMLCVAAACIGRVVTLAPGQEWSARQSFEA